MVLPLFAGEWLCDAVHRAGGIVEDASRTNLRVLLGRDNVESRPSERFLT